MRRSAKIARAVLSGQDDPGRAKAGLHVAKRIHDARAEHGTEGVARFPFTQGLPLADEPDSELGCDRPTCLGRPRHATLASLGTSAAAGPSCRELGQGASPVAARHG